MPPCLIHWFIFMFSIYSICIWKKLPAPFLISLPMKHCAQIIDCACLVTVYLKILSLQSEHIIRTLKSVTSWIFYPLLLCRTCCLEDFVIAMYRDLLNWILCLITYFYSNFYLPCTLFHMLKVLYEQTFCLFCTQKTIFSILHTHFYKHLHQSIYFTHIFN